MKIKKILAGFLAGLMFCGAVPLKKDMFPDFSFKSKAQSFESDRNTYTSSITGDEIKTDNSDFVKYVESIGSVPVGAIPKINLVAETTGTMDMSFELVQPESIFDAGDSFQLKWTGSGKPTSFETNNSYVTVDSSGYVNIDYNWQSYNWGSEKVTITASNSYCTDSVTIEVKPIIITTTAPPPEIYLDEPDISDLYLGNTFKIDYSVDYYYSSIQWSSSNKDIASVDSSGNVTINGYGEVNITAEINGGYYYSRSDSVTFTVPYPTPEIKLAIPDEKKLFVGNKLKLDYTSSNTDNIKWSSSNPNVADVDDKGYITVNGVGKVTINAVASNQYGNTANDSITIYTYQSGTSIPSSAMKILPAEIKMSVGDTSELVVINIPENTAVKWTSDNTSAVTVSDGIIKAVKSGTATIYAIAGNDIAQCKVTVISNNAVLKGDVTDDGIVEIADIVVIASYVGDSKNNPLSSDAIVAGDVHNTGDGLTANDVLMLQQYIAGIITEL